MADIVQLKENGTFKYLKTHAKAVEGLDVEMAKKQNLIVSSGLRYPTMGGGASSHATFRVNYEKVGRLVLFGGRALLPVVTATQVQIASVPLEFAPQQQKFIEVPIAGKQTDLFAKIVIDVDGIIYCYFCNSASQYFSLDSVNYLSKD